RVPENCTCRRQRCQPKDDQDEMMQVTDGSCACGPALGATETVGRIDHRESDGPKRWAEQGAKWPTHVRTSCAATSRTRSRAVARVKYCHARQIGQAATRSWANRPSWRCRRHKSAKSAAIVQ